MRRAWLLVAVLSLAAGVAGAVALTRLSDGSDARVATARLIVATDPCADAMAALRMLTTGDEGSVTGPELTAGLVRLERDCPAGDAEAFRAQLLAPSAPKGGPEAALHEQSS